LPYEGFEAVFRAYSNDQVLGRTLLAPDVAEELIKLARLFPERRLIASLIGNVMTLGLQGYHQFEFFKLDKPIDKDSLRDAARQIYLVITLAQAFEKAWKAA